MGGAESSGRIPDVLAAGMFGEQFGFSYKKTRKFTDLFGAIVDRGFVSGTFFYMIMCHRKGEGSTSHPAR